MPAAFRSVWWPVFSLVASVATLFSGTALAEPPADIQFNRDIRPILADHCFQCHGPDSVQRKADLRLDTEVGARADLGGRRAVVPGKPDESELLARILSSDPAERMPPDSIGKPLSASQIELLKTWISQGATWQKHWSFLPPEAPAIPPVARQDWVRNPIDAFILARLEKEGLAPSNEADRTTLLRRVTLDLTGLPPTPAEVDAFVADPSEAHYRAVVDQLLASPRFAERMAVRWLDGARYADTSGYQSDGERFMWRWRDWVLEAYHNNMPFDRFTVEQLAGDLLPNATLDQKIATGFNRNHRGNGEGGIIPEEYAVEYVVDRVETTFTVWMGLTMGCGRCHDHKFDPLSQREFYQAYAFFNNIPEYGRAWKYGNSPPSIKSPTREQQLSLTKLEGKLAVAQAKYAEFEIQLPALQSAWERTITDGKLPDWTIDRDLARHWPLNGSLDSTGPVANGAGGYAARKSQGPGAISNLLSAAPGSTVRSVDDPWFVRGEPAFAEGRFGQAAVFDGTRFVEAGDTANFGFYDAFTLSAWIQPSGAEGGTILSRMTDADQADGYAFVLKNGRLQLNLVKRWLDDALRVETEEPIEGEEWHHVLATYDGSRVASGVAIYVDGRPLKLKVNLDLLNQTFASKEPFRIGGGNGPQGRFHGLIDDVRTYAVALSLADAQIVAVPDSLSRILAIPAGQRSEAQRGKLAAYYLEQAAPEELRHARETLLALRRERFELLDSFPTTMVMEEIPQPKPAHVLIRGVYDRPGEPVARGVPQVLSEFPAGAPANRLGLAQWLVDKRHPLTSRVAVNRLWQMLFGIGLVKSVDDFGSQGEWPSHPELLDWLAVEFQRGPEETLEIRGVVPKDHAWDVKALIRAIVTSSTYRQSSKTNPELIRRDPENRLLARGPRVRLAAEMVRDQALAAAGLLVEKLGGPSVKPYQPEGLWKELSDTEYTQDHGSDLYRRSLYTFWKRTIAPPTMITFDAAGRETCIVRETRTNTPLQALTLMNETSFVEAARVLAERALREGGATPAERISFAFRRVLGRPPRDAELAVLRAGWERNLKHYRQNPEAAESLLKVGEFPREEGLDVTEHAAMTALCGLLLNLDEAITKE
ncbi:MAG: DUF1553 domain-containing protein [Planctomycetota bacterium]|nr:DUF1553 domain-containing protein [Planctomycetota bacterium]